MTVDPQLASRALAPVKAQPKAAVSAPQPKAAEPGQTQTPAETGADLSFDDVIDTLNPLHHLPGVSLAYEAATGDKISLPAKLVGGFLFGGPMGLAGSVALAVFESVTGDSIGGHLRSLVGLDEPAGTATASQTPGQTPGQPSAQPSPQTTPAAAAAAQGVPPAVKAAPRQPTAAALAEALHQAAPSIPTKLPTTPPAAAPDPLRPDPLTLAKLYSLQAVGAGRWS